MRPAYPPIPCALSILLAAVLYSSGAFAATDIGQVIAVVPGAEVLRDGTTEALAVHAGIRVSDTVRTDASGRVKILFNDDSTVSIGPNTAMDMNEYADAGATSSFGLNVPQGVVRALTGKIVDQNPGGFKITTPEATVGIRGTIISLRTGKGVTTVYVENTLRQVYVNNIRVPSGHKITLPGDAARAEPIQPQDRRDLGRDLALLGGTGVAAAAPEAGTDGARRSPTEQLTSASPGNFLPPDTLLKTTAFGTQSLGDALASAPVIAPPPIGSLNGTVSGSLTSSLHSGINGSFGFNVNLSTGAISNGTVNFNAPDWLVNMSGGTGSANHSGFTMTTSNPGMTQLIAGMPISGAYANVAGSTNLLSVPSGSSVTGTYTLHNPNSTATNPVDSGSALGTITKR